MFTTQIKYYERHDICFCSFNVEQKSERTKGEGANNYKLTIIGGKNRN